MIEDHCDFQFHEKKFMNLKIYVPDIMSYK